MFLQTLHVYQLLPRNSGMLHKMYMNNIALRLLPRNSGILYDICMNITVLTFWYTLRNLHEYHSAYLKILVYFMRSA